MIDLLMTDPKAEPRTNPMTELLANSMLVRFPNPLARRDPWVKEIVTGHGPTWDDNKSNKHPIAYVHMSIHMSIHMSTLIFFVLEVWKEKLPAYWGTGFPTHFQEQVSRRTWLIPCLTAVWPYNEYPMTKLMTDQWPTTLSQPKPGPGPHSCNVFYTYQVISVLKGVQDSNQQH